MRDPLLEDMLAALDPAQLFRRALGMEPMPHQVDYLRETTRPILVNKGRQTGFSTAAAVKAIATVLYEPDIQVVLISPTLKQSSAITAIARQGLRNLGETLLGDSVSMLRLTNGSAIQSLPGTARSARGYTARVLVLDEFAYLLPETIVAARALVATGGQIIRQSTPAGAGGPFFDAWQQHEEDEVRFEVRSDEVPTISADWLAQERRSLGPAAYAQEYECSFSGAGASLFDADRLRDLVLPNADPLWERVRNAT